MSFMLSGKDLTNKLMMMEIPFLEVQTGSSTKPFFVPIQTDATGTQWFMTPKK